MPPFFGQSPESERNREQADLERLQRRARERMQERRAAQHKRQEVDLSRRRALKFLGGLGAIGVGGALASRLSGESSPSYGEPSGQASGAVTESEHEDTLVLEMVQRGEIGQLTPERYPEIAELARRLAKQFAPTTEHLLRRPALNSPDRSFDLPMNAVPEVMEIRSIADPHLRFLRAVGYLGVQTQEDLGLPDHQSSNPRYRNGDGKTWTCNLYAQDLARLILEKDHRQAFIGHWTKTIDEKGEYTETGAPVHLSYADRLKMSQETYNAWMKRHRQMDSYDMMRWMSSATGQGLGWKRVGSQAELFRDLQAGHLGYGGTNPELLQTDENPNGIERGNYHNFVLGWSPALPDFPNGIPLLSQSTNCKFLESDLRSNKFNPEGRLDDGNIQYAFFVKMIQ